MDKELDPIMEVIIREIAEEIELHSKASEKPVQDKDNK
jgi:hypothetical protein